MRPTPSDSTSPQGRFAYSPSILSRRASVSACARLTESPARRAVERVSTSALSTRKKPAKAPSNARLGPSVKNSTPTQRPTTTMRPVMTLPMFTSLVLAGLARRNRGQLFGTPRPKDDDFAHFRGTLDAQSQPLPSSTGPRCVGNWETCLAPRARGLPRSLRLWQLVPPTDAPRNSHVGPA